MAKECSLYILYDFAFVSGIDWTCVGIRSGNWQALFTIVGNPFVVLASHDRALIALGIVLFAGIVGPFLIGYVYMGSDSRCSLRWECWGKLTLQ